MESLTGFVSDDELVYAPLHALGWEVEAVPWRRADVDWTSFDAVIIRTTWDYQKAAEEFVGVLRQIEHAGTHLENALGLVQWNMRKTYLRDLQARGVPIVPTVLGTDLGPVDEATILRRRGVDDVVLKPVVGANADHTYRLRRGASAWS